METKLRNLKENMDNTVLKPGKISSTEKNKIFHTVINDRGYKRRNYFAPIMSAIIVMSFSMLFINFLFHNLFDGKAETGNSETPLLEKGSIDVHKGNDAASEQYNPSPGPNYPYIIFNGYYYKKIDKEAKPEQISIQAGNVERTGNWTIKKSGDSNEVPPGPIYYLIGTAPETITAKGVSYKNGKNSEAFLVFRKADKVEETKTEEIISDKNDPQEAKNSFEKIKKKVSILYGFKGLENRTTLQSVYYSEGPKIVTNYHVPEGDIRANGTTTPGILFINQYGKEVHPENSRFIAPVTLEKVKEKDGSVKFERANLLIWKEPVKIETFSYNGVIWSFYKDSFNHDIVLKGETGTYTIEITTQGNFSMDSLKNLLGFYGKVN